jgi:SnoaL-like domain
MTAGEQEQIIQSVKQVADSIIRFAEEASANSLLDCYANSQDFLSCTGDGKMRNFEGFKDLCTKFYDSIKGQRIYTVQEKFHVMDRHLVIFAWTGSIHVFFKSGEILIMKEYALTCIFKKVDHQWKVIHSHESCLPGEIQNVPTISQD